MENGLFSNEKFSSRSVLIGCEEANTRYNGRYRGASPKKRVPSNLNYYDHNILNLQNRALEKIDYSGEILFKSIGTGLPRSSSNCNFHKNVSEKVTEKNVILGSSSSANLFHYMKTPEVNRNKISNIKFGEEQNFYRKSVIEMEGFKLRSKSVSENKKIPLSTRQNISGIDLKENLYTQSNNIIKETQQKAEMNKHTTLSKAEIIKDSWQKEYQQIKQIELQNKKQHCLSKVQDITPKITERSAPVPIPGNLSRKPSKEEYRNQLLVQIEEDRQRRIKSRVQEKTSVILPTSIPNTPQLEQEKKKQAIIDKFEKAIEIRPKLQEINTLERALSQYTKQIEKIQSLKRINEEKLKSIINVQAKLKKQEKSGSKFKVCSTKKQSTNNMRKR